MSDDAQYRQATHLYWQWMRTQKLWMCETWRENFDAFYADAGPRVGAARLKRINTSRMFEPGNVKWVGGKRVGTGGKPGPVAKLQLADVLEILDLGHKQGMATKDIAALTPKASIKDVQDILAGRRYKVEGYDYTTVENRAYGEGRPVPKHVRNRIREAYAAGAHPSVIARRWGMTEEKVFAILARA